MYAWLLMVSLLTADQAPGPPVALVVDVKAGPAQRGAGVVDSIRRFAALRANETLQPATGTVTLFFPKDGHLEIVQPGKKVTVTANGCDPPSAVQRQAPRVKNRNLEGIRELVIGGRAGVAIYRSDGNDTKTPVITPMIGTTVVSDQPTLSWPRVPGAASYHVEFRNGAEGKDSRVLWRASTKNTSLPFPERQKPLSHNTLYRWQVTAGLANGRDEHVADGEFLVASKETALAVEELKLLLTSKDDADLLLAALTYESFSIFDEALPLYEQLARRCPNDGYLQVTLSEYYGRAGKHELSQAARKRAKQLGARLPDEDEPPPAKEKKP